MVCVSDNGDVQTVTTDAITAVNDLTGTGLFKKKNSTAALAQWNPS